jgi:signal recognition particle subunit SEC65
MSLSRAEFRVAATNIALAKVREEDGEKVVDDLRGLIQDLFKKANPRFSEEIFDEWIEEKIQQFRAGGEAK